ncbi:hypothetical protein GCM10011404_13900 [Sphingomonas prati]|uniref:DUF2975 domain-containing protein n=2 Tax=Sphingomonas prati TaxID=1843237 RepID=A0A7W9BQ12_9SPHN|nr:hypothetical protein [Sphingomonas prati]MBB5727994.1 hypothetical protein [Sphingomonas prati]GGE82454.1 hypothetical protein GCM10011404_13900 [Sphingomonas prati]
MSDSYILPPRKAFICRMAGVVFLLVATIWGGATVSQSIMPGWSLACSDSGACHPDVDPGALLPDAERASVSSDPAARARFAAYAARPRVRAGLAGLILFDEVFLIFLFVAVGLTLRRLGGAGGPVLARALPWLKRGALSAVLWAIVQPLTDSLRAMLLFPGTPSGASWYIALDLTVAGPAMLLAIAAYATAWALEAGIRAERDLATFV